MLAQATHIAPPRTRRPLRSISHAAAALPQWKYLLSWLLLWPMLNLVARQAPFLAGPARSEAQIKEGAAAGAGADYHMALYVMLAFQLVFVVQYAKQIYALLLRNRLLIACLALPLLSSLWSDNVGNSLRMSISADLCLLFAAYLYLRFPLVRLQHFLMFVGVVSALLCAFTALALPRYGIFAEYGGGAWQGICSHKNTMGDSMAYLLTPIFFVPGLTRLRRAGYAFLMLFLIAMSQSRGAWIDTAALCVFVDFLWLLRALRKAERWLLILVGSGVAIAVLLAVIASFQTIAPMLGKDASMSGRSDIYRLCWLAFLHKPVFGYGYGGFWATAPEASQIGLSIGWTNIGYAENGLLEIALQLGCVGLLLILTLLARAAFQGFRLVAAESSWHSSAWYLSILLLALLTNIDAGWLLVPGTLDWVMIVIACLGLNHEWRKRAHARTKFSAPAPRTKFA